MKVLLDEDVPYKLARLLPQHDIHTVVAMRWGGIKNGALLELIGQERFELFLTAIRIWRVSRGLKADPLPCWSCP